MAKISDESRFEFNTKSKPIKAEIEEMLKKEKEIVAVMKRDTGGVEYKKLLLAEQMIYIATLYIQINSLSMYIMKTRNNDMLNDARKMLYKAIIYLEEIVSTTVDCPYTDLVPNWEKIANTPVEKRYYLVRKLGLCIQMLVDAFGDNSKWKWSFVEMRGRFTVVAKNLIDMKKASKDFFEPSSPEYDSTVLYVRLIKKLIDQSAQDYRDKYELSSRRIDDMKMAINFLLALRRIAIVMNDKDEAEELKKKASVWKGKMEADQKSGRVS